MNWTRFTNPVEREETDDEIMARFDRLDAEKKTFGETLWDAFERRGAIALPARDPTWTRVSLTHSTYPGVKYQVTRWDEQGPVGHLDASSKQSAVDEMWYYVGGLDWRERWRHRRTS